jgi:TatD DNase family protein
MLVDSHCHLNFPELQSNIEEIRASMADNKVGHALCISVTLKDFPQVLALAETYSNFYASVGVHPDYEDRYTCKPP